MQEGVGACMGGGGEKVFRRLDREGRGSPLLRRGWGKGESFGGGKDSGRVEGVGSGWVLLFFIFLKIN